MSLLRKGILIFSGQALGVALSVLAGMLFSRNLGPDGMGQVDIFRSTATIVCAFLGMGIGQAGIYFLNSRKVPLSTIVTNTVKIGLVLGVVVAVAFAAAVFLAPGYFGVVPAVAVVAFALGVSCSLGTSLLRPVLVAQLAARRMVAVDLIPPAVILTGGLLLWSAHWLAPATVLVVQAVAPAGGGLLLLVYFRHNIDPSQRFDWPLLGRVLIYGLKLAAGNILSVLSLNITLILLRLMMPARFEEVGLYARAVGICGLILMVPVAMVPLLYAKWSGMAGEERARQTEMAMRLNMAYSVVSAVGVIMFGKYIIWLLYGAGFVSAHEALIFLAPGMLFALIGGVCSNLFASDGRAIITAWILAGTVIVIAAVTYLAVPLLGIRGAALGMLCGNVFTAIASMVACRHLYGLRPLHCLVPTRSDVRYVLDALGWAGPPESAARRKKSGDDRLA
jgi:O-antigen/teichoic acid export membrane protein